MTTLARRTYCPVDLRRTTASCWDASFARVARHPCRRPSHTKGVTVTLGAGRPYKFWALTRPSNPLHISRQWAESANVPLLIEAIRGRAEIASRSKQQFSGSLRQKNVLWTEYRNYLRQGISNFEASMNVPNRSSGLLLYYAALNFAKAELLDTHHQQLVNKRIGHGLSFNPTRARSVKGDQLTVISGDVFPLLYERRTGKPWPKSERLDIRRLLTQVPEIATQSLDLGLRSRVTGLYQMVAADDAQCWVVLAVVRDLSLTRKTKTRELFLKHFRPIQRHRDWRDHFALSRRLVASFDFYESIKTVPVSIPGQIPIHHALNLSWALRDVLSAPSDEFFDAWITPYLLDTRAVALPASLARYALLFYASSLVRYKPAMFDAQLHPEQALLFDAIARECALPLLMDTLSGLERTDHVFEASGSFRL